MKKRLLLGYSMLTWFVLTSCDGLVYVDNPVENETKTAKELAAKALIGTWKKMFPRNIGMRIINLQTS